MKTHSGNRPDCKHPRVSFPQFRRNHYLSSARFRFLVNWICPVNYRCGSTSELGLTISDLRYARTPRAFARSLSGDRCYIGRKFFSFSFKTEKLRNTFFFFDCVLVSSLQLY